MPEDMREALIAQLLKMGFTAEEAEQALTQLDLVKKGNIYGHVHTEDIAEIVHRAIDGQGTRSITLKISRDGDDETYDGHLNIEVIEISPG